MDVRKRIVVVGLVTILQVEHLYVITLRYQNISVGVKQFALRITEYIIAVKLQQLRAGYAVALAGAGRTEHNDVLVAVVVVLRCYRHRHGKAQGLCGRQGDILVFLNSDVFPIRNSIHNLVSYLEENRATTGAVQGLLIYPQTNKVQSTGHLFLDLQNAHVYQYSDIHKEVIYKCSERQALTSAFCAIPRDIFIKNGRFNEYYYNAYEGFELTLKINNSGLKCIYYPEAIAYHIGGGTRNSMDISETQQGKYFIQNWGDIISTDIDKYILPQLNEEILSKMYSGVILSHLNGWENILQKLNFSINGYVYRPHSGEANLYNLFPYSFLNFGGNYLFITESINDISKNYNWIKNRNNPNDIVIDLHGNVIKLQEFLI